LEKLIGFSTAEMLAMRQEMPNNPLLKEKLKNVCSYIMNYIFASYRYVLFDKYLRFGIGIVVVHDALRFYVLKHSSDNSMKLAGHVVLVHVCLSLPSGCLLLVSPLKASVHRSSTMCAIYPTISFA
jgi:hypothetical protein